MPVPLKPDLLSDEAEPHWPDLDRWPTPQETKSFLKATRRNSSLRLELLSGLRAFSLADGAPVTSWLGLWLSLVGIFAAQPIEIVWVRWLVLGGFALLGFVLLVRIAEFSAAMDLRRRMSATWLAAFEDALTKRS